MKNVKNICAVMEIVGLVLVIFASRIFDREYFIGIFHGAGIVLFFCGIIYNIIVTIRATKKASEQ